MFKGKVLLVDDDAVHRIMAKKIMSDLGCSVIAVDNAITAIAKLRAQPETYALVFMDWEMPEMTGLQAAEKIRAQQGKRNWPHIPIIAFTSNKSDGDQEKCLAAGMDDYMAKEIFLPKWQNLLQEKLEKWGKVSDERYDG